MALLWFVLKYRNLPFSSAISSKCTVALCFGGHITVIICQYIVLKSWIYPCVSYKPECDFLSVILALCYFPWSLLRVTIIEKMFNYRQKWLVLSFHYAALARQLTDWLYLWGNMSCWCFIINTLCVKVLVHIIRDI